MNLAKQMEEATPRNKERVGENWLETIKIYQSDSYHRRMGKNGRRSTVIFKSGTIVNGHCD